MASPTWGPSWETFSYLALSTRPALHGRWDVGTLVTAVWIIIHADQWRAINPWRFYSRDEQSMAGAEQKQLCVLLRYNISIYAAARPLHRAATAAASTQQRSLKLPFSFSSSTAFNCFQSCSRLYVCGDCQETDYQRQLNTRLNSSLSSLMNRYWPRPRPKTRK